MFSVVNSCSRIILLSTVSYHFNDFCQGSMTRLQVHTDLILQYIMSSDLLFSSLVLRFTYPNSMSDAKKHEMLIHPRTVTTVTSLCSLHVLLYLYLYLYLSKGLQCALTAIYIYISISISLTFIVGYYPVNGSSLSEVTSSVL